MIIGIDHGNLQIKTAHCVFQTGLKKYPFNLDFGNVLEYSGAFYSLNPERMAYVNDKTKNNNFYVLTLIALAKELEARKAGQQASVDLAVGLPPGEYSEQNKARLCEYLKRNGTVDFKYSGKEYSITINKVQCYMQALSAAIAANADSEDMKNCVVVDIGGYTVDVLNFRNGQVEQSLLRSLNKGIIHLLNDIKSAVRGYSGLILRDEDIYTVFCGEKTMLSDKVIAIIKFMRDEYAEDILHFVEEQSIWDLKVNHSFFTGGGSLYLQNYLQNCGELGAPVFITDIHSNAIGYEKQMSADINGSQDTSTVIESTREQEQMQSML